MTAPADLGNFETAEETEALRKFKALHPDLFKKSDADLYTHLIILISILAASTACGVLSPWILAKIFFGVTSAFCWFSLINVTIHHHMTHRNAAESETAKRVMDVLYFIAVPNSGRRKARYTRAHMNHHFRPFHETDVDHHYGTERYLSLIRGPLSAALYFLELTFVGGHVPGWLDDGYMNKVPLEKWNVRDYKDIKMIEVKKARETAFLQWSGFLILVFFAPLMGDKTFLPAIAWGWVFPMLLVKNWAHFLGQFQHYEMEFLEEGRSINRRTRTYNVPSWLNYLTGGELSGHFLHHLYPEMPYYRVETARQVMSRDPELTKLFFFSA